MSAIKINPDFSLGYYNISYSKYNLGDDQKAIIDIKKAIELDSEYCDSYNLMGLIYNNLTTYDSAFLSFRDAYLCDTTNSLFAYNAAYMLYDEGSYEDALIYFNAALSKGYDDIDMLSYIGICYDNLEMYEKAIEFHSIFIEKNDQNYIGYYNRGLAHYNLKDYESAIADFNTSAVCDSTDSDIFYQLGQCYEKLEKHEEAETYLNKAIQMSVDNAGYYDTRAAFYANVGKYDLAIEDSEISLELYPDDCNIYMLMSSWYNELDQKEKSDAALKKALELGCKE